eukprot:763794-Hanusia_phi.AAC.5
MRRRDGEGLTVVGACCSYDGDEELVRLQLDPGDQNLKLPDVGSSKGEEGDLVLRAVAVRQVPQRDPHQRLAVGPSCIPADCPSRSLGPLVSSSRRSHGGRAEVSSVEERDIEASRRQVDATPPRAHPLLEEREHRPVLVRQLGRLPGVLESSPTAILRREADAGEMHVRGEGGEEAGGVEAGEEEAVDVAHAGRAMHLEELPRQRGGEGARGDGTRLHERWPSLVEADGDAVGVSYLLVLQDLLDLHRHRLRLPARAQPLAVQVASGGQDVGVPPRLVELQHGRGHDRADRPGAEDAHNAMRLIAELSPPRLPDLPAPHRVVPPPRLVFVCAQAQLEASLLAVGACLVSARPDLVAVLQEDLHVRPQRSAHELCHLLHVLVAGGVGDAEPGGGAEDVGERDHVLQRHPRVGGLVDVGLRRRAWQSPLAPLLHSRVIDALPVHEAEGAEGRDVAEEEGVELEPRACGGQTGREDADVPDGVKGVDVVNPQVHAIVAAVGLEGLDARPVDGGIELDLHPILRPADHLGVKPELYRPSPLVLHQEPPARRVLLDAAHHELPEGLPGPEP